jgi:quercetin dioxygenase-like cupin family protein
MGFAPGGSMTWHTHPDTDFAVVKAGTLTDNVADCSQAGVYNVGEAFTHNTGSVHLARNLRTTPLVFDATFIDPAGVPPTHPGCDFS